MKAFNVLLTDSAYADLVEIRNWVALQADEATANAFVDRIQTRLAKLAHFPERGTPHPEIRADIRSLSFERNYLIFFHASGEIVWIDRIVSAKRDLGNLN